MTWRVTLLAACVAMLPLSMAWYGRHEDTSVDAMLNASVSVKTLSHVRIDAVGDSVWNPTSGSGFLISADKCEVLTNHHVVADAARIEIYPRKWSEPTGIPAKVANSNPRSDIAILRMEHCAGMSRAQLGDSNTLAPGDEVYAVGNPLGRNPDSISRGIVSHTERFTSAIIPYIQTDASINRGSSGGALFNHQGKVIGINTAIIAAPNGGSLGVGYALPINMVKREIRKLRAGPPTWGDAGIEDMLAALTEHQAAFFNVPPGQAALILTDSPTSGPSAGKLFAKDVIYRIGSSRVTGITHARQMISGYEAGDTISFQVVRGGEFLMVEVTTAEGRDDPESHNADYYVGHLGLTLEMWGEDDPVRGRYDAPVITLVHGLGPAHLAHVSSSQKTLARNGPMIMPVQLDVKTVSGLVLDGTYHAAQSVEAVEKLSARAFAAGNPVLLEVETWSRRKPLDFDLPLERINTTFHTIVPAITTAAVPVMEEPTTEDVGRIDTESNELAYFQSEWGH